MSERDAGGSPVHIEPYGVYDTADVCAMFKTHRMQVKKWRDDGQLTSLSHLGRSVRFSGRALIALIESIDGQP